MIIATSLSIVMSGALLAVLAAHDPKRLRNQTRMKRRDDTTVTTLRPALRGLFGWLVLAPGVGLAALGEWWAFLIWLGVTCALGWLLSQLCAVPGAALGNPD